MVPCCVSRSASLPSSRFLHQAEVEQLDHIEDAAALAGDDVARLDVAVEQADPVGFLQGTADLAQEMDGPSGRQGTVARDQLVQVLAGQVFHDVVKGAVVGMAVVVNLDGVPVRQRRHRLHLALEAMQVGRVAGLLRADQLDGAGAAQQQVFGQVDLAHAAGAEPLA